MSRLTISNSDFISISDKKDDYLDIQYAFSLPTEEDIDMQNCIVTVFTSNGISRKYKSFYFINAVNKEILNNLQGDYVYISRKFNIEEVDTLIKNLEKRHL